MSGDRDEEKCQNCKFCIPDLYSDHSRCMRNPPAIIGPNGLGIWPLVDGANWCGEFRPATISVDISFEMLSVRTRNFCKRMGIKSLPDLAERSIDDLFEGSNFCRSIYKEITEILARHGMKLKNS